MWHDDDFFDREEDVSRRRRHRRRLECGCREERGEHECGCERCEGREHERGREHGREHERFERERRGRHCGSCICREIAELRKLQRVDLFLKSSEEIRNVRFIDFDDNTCCANFTKCSEEHDELIIVNCRDVVALRIKSQ